MKQSEKFIALAAQAALTEGDASTASALLNQLTSVAARVTTPDTYAADALMPTLDDMNRQGLLNPEEEHYSGGNDGEPLIDEESLKQSMGIGAINRLEDQRKKRAARPSALRNREVQVARGYTLK